MIDAKENMKTVFGVTLVVLVIFQVGGCVDFNVAGGSSSDTDTDTDTNSDSDTGPDDTDYMTDPDFDMCEEYPESDDNFAEGSTIRNYLFFDKQDNEIEVCEFSKTHELMLVKLNSDGWQTSSLEVPELLAVQEKYSDAGLVIIEILKPATDAEYLQNHCGEHDHYGLRTDPADIVFTDYQKTEILINCGIYALVNLNNMRVLEPMCGDNLTLAEECIQEFL